jgi:hypothetical protein
MRSPQGVIRWRCCVACSRRKWRRSWSKEFYPKAYPKPTGDDASFNAPNAYKVVATLDLDGDGKLEVVVGSSYHEGQATTIYRCDPKKVEALLSVSCGA